METKFVDWIIKWKQVSVKLKTYRGRWEKQCRWAPRYGTSSPEKLGAIITIALGKRKQVAGGNFHSHETGGETQMHGYLVEVPRASQSHSTGYELQEPIGWPLSTSNCLFNREKTLESATSQIHINYPHKTEIILVLLFRYQILMKKIIIHPHSFNPF